MSTSKQSTAVSGKRYSPAFKQEALALLAAGRSVNQVSQDLGVSIWTLRDWKKQSELASLPLAEAETHNADPATLIAEVARLRKALAVSELHADILKKALAIVGQPPPDSSR